MTKDTKKELLDEFSKLELENYGKWKIDRNLAKSFLSQALDKIEAEAKAKILENIRSESPDYAACIRILKEKSRQETIQRCIEVLPEKKEFSNDEKHRGCMAYKWLEGYELCPECSAVEYYNSCRQEVIKALNKLL